MDIEKFIKGRRTCLLGSIDEEGFPNTRAMLKPRKFEGYKTLYFSTNTSSNKIKHYQNNNKASVYFYDGLLFKGVMLIGEIEILTEQKYKDMLWEKGDTLYYPKGITDPDYIVLKFTTKQVRTYANMKKDDFNI